MARVNPPINAADPMLTASYGGRLHHSVQRLSAAATIPRALAYMTLVALAVLLIWLRLRVDLVIFAGVLFAISLRRAAEALGRLLGLPVGWSLLTVFLLILAFCAGIGLVLFASDRRPDHRSCRSNCPPPPTSSPR